MVIGCEAIVRDPICQIMNQLPKLKQDQRFILGIDGLSRSGKTTFMKQVEQLLQETTVSFCLFHIDDLIVEKDKRYHTGYEEWYEYYHLQWDVRWLRKHFFAKLKERDELLLPFYDSNYDTQEWQVTKLPPSCLIIIEGVFLQRKEWRPFYDYLIYLDCTRETRFSRESAATQKKIDKFQNRYWIAEEYYMKTVNPVAQADWVIKNER
jgi:uridine kinase